MCMQDHWVGDIVGGAGGGEGQPSAQGGHEKATEISSTEPPSPFYLVILISVTGPFSLVKYILIAATGSYIPEIVWLYHRPIN